MGGTDEEFFGGGRGGGGRAPPAARAPGAAWGGQLGAAKSFLKPFERSANAWLPHLRHLGGTAANPLFSFRCGLVRDGSRRLHQIGGVGRVLGLCPCFGFLFHLRLLSGRRTMAG